MPLIQAIPPVRGRRGRPRQRPDAVYADRGYDHDKYRKQVREKGITPVIARRGTEHGSGLGVHRWAVARLPAGSAQHGWLASRLADALYRIGDRARAEQVAIRALEQTCEPDLLVDLHWTLAQCRMLAGSSAESLATLDRALASPGISVRHRARLLVLAARTHFYLGKVEEGGRVATSALAAASEAGDNWAMAWALHVLTLVVAVQGHLTDALPLFDRALTVTESDPALTDLRLLLQINQAVTLGCLDQHKQAFAVAREARHLAGQVGTTMRLAQAHGALSQLLFETGRWDDALAEVGILPEDLKEPAGACCELGIAAVICFHRGEIDAARRHLAAAVPHAERLGHRPIGLLALARSLDREHADALPEALAALTNASDNSTEDIGEIEDLLADAVRLAAATGDLTTAEALAGHAAALAAEAEIPHRQANALYCRGLLDHDASRLVAAAERYDDASRPLLRAKALEAAAGHFVDADDRGQARAVFTRAWRSTPRWARPRTSPGCRPPSALTASGAGRRPSSGAGLRPTVLMYEPCAPRPSFWARSNRNESLNCESEHAERDNLNTLIGAVSK